MVSVPQSYLPPASQPWGRAIETNLSAVERDARINSLNTDNALRGISANVNLLTQQQNDLTIAQEELAQTQQTLQNQQNTLVGIRPRFAGDDLTYSYGYVLKGPVDGTFLRDKVLYTNLTLPYTNIILSANALCSIALSANAIPGFTASANYRVHVKIWYKNVTTGYISSVQTFDSRLSRTFVGPTSQQAYISDKLNVTTSYSTTLWGAGSYEIHVEYYYYLDGDWGSITLTSATNTAILSDGML